jgi:hypothetical protein
LKKENYVDVYDLSNGSKMIHGQGDEPCYHCIYVLRNIPDIGLVTTARLSFYIQREDDPQGQFSRQILVLGCQWASDYDYHLEIIWQILVYTAKVKYKMETIRVFSHLLYVCEPFDKIINSYELYNQEVDGQKILYLSIDVPKLNDPKLEAFAMSI